MLTRSKLQKYEMVVQSMIEMGVDIVYPVELPSQASLTIDGQNCFERVVCKFCCRRCGGHC
jgi:amidase